MSDFDFGDALEASFAAHGLKPRPRRVLLQKPSFAGLKQSVAAVRTQEAKGVALRGVLMTAETNADPSNSIENRVLQLEKPGAVKHNQFKHMQAAAAKHKRVLMANDMAIPKPKIPQLIPNATPQAPRHAPTHGHRSAFNQGTIPKSGVFHCSVCPFKSFVKLHVDRHTSTLHSAMAKPDECCDMFFYTRYEMQEHNLTTHKVQKFSCPFKCKVTFVRRQLLVRHIAGIHGGDKPWRCPMCPYRATMKYHLERHFKGLHQDLNFEQLKRKMADAFDVFLVPGKDMNEAYDEWDRATTFVKTGAAAAQEEAAVAYQDEAAGLVYQEEDGEDPDNPDEMEIGEEEFSVGAEEFSIKNEEIDL